MSRRRRPSGDLFSRGPRHLPFECCQDRDSKLLNVSSDEHRKSTLEVYILMVSLHATVVFYLHVLNSDQNSGKNPFFINP